MFDVMVGKFKFTADELISYFRINGTQIDGAYSVIGNNRFCSFTSLKPEPDTIVTVENMRELWNYEIHELIAYGLVESFDLMKVSEYQDLELSGLFKERKKAYDLEGYHYRYLMDNDKFPPTFTGVFQLQPDYVVDVSVETMGNGLSFRFIDIKLDI